MKLQSLSAKFPSMDLRGQALSVLCLTAQLLTSKCLQGLVDFKARQVLHAHTEFGARKKMHSLLQSWRHSQRSFNVSHRWFVTMRTDYSRRGRSSMSKRKSIDEINVSSLSSFKKRGRRTYQSWTWSELETLWRNPSMTAKELHELIPTHSVQAITMVRHRYGRYRTEGIVPLCQKCGQHPVWVDAEDAKRWGLCKECALDEREYLRKHTQELERKQNLERQLAFKMKRKKERKAKVKGIEDATTHKRKP
nr:MAG TPA: hypothetical protein [Caudoviricetes sp.]